MMVGGVSSIPSGMRVAPPVVAGRLYVGRPALTPVAPIAATESIGATLQPGSSAGAQALHGVTSLGGILECGSGPDSAWALGASCHRPQLAPWDAPFAYPLPRVDVPYVPLTPKLSPRPGMGRGSDRDGAGGDAGPGPGPGGDPPSDGPPREGASTWPSTLRRVDDCPVPSFAG